MKNKLLWLLKMSSLTLPFIAVSCQSQQPTQKPKNPSQKNPDQGSGPQTPEPIRASLTKEQQDLINFYVRNNNEERFDIENKKIVDRLKLINERFKNLPKQQGDVYRNQNNLAASSQNVSKFDNLAKNLNIDTFDNQRYKSNTVPSYKENGEVDGLNIQVKWDFLENQTEPELAKLKENVHGKGLGRTLVNQKYKDIALQTYSINFVEKSGSSHFGTAWIIDYELTEDGSYPKKWYIATNLHVGNMLNDNTTYFNLTRLDPEAPLNENLTLRSPNTINYNNKPVNKYFTTFQINLEIPDLKDKVKMVYKAVDFLKADPKDYLSQQQQTKFTDFKEYIDFAVLEIDFSSKTDTIGLEIRNPKNENSFASAEEFMEKLTNGFANNKEVKFIPESYLTNYGKINLPLVNDDWSTNDTLFALGYPKDFDSDFLSWPRDITGDQIVPYVEKRYNFDYNFRNLWTNQTTLAPKYIDISENTGEVKTKDNNNAIGNRLTNSPTVTTFKNKPGVFDNFLTWPLVATDTEPLKTIYQGKSTPLIQMGLGYSLANYEAPGGASGSSVRNQNNELVSIFHSIGHNTLLGMSTAFRSEGFDYQGLYGSYNLPQYDLIYGGGKDQLTSYREELQKLYPNAKTHLFPKGLSVIPNEFKFNK
ncbi:Ig-specific serine endopeptidase MIP [Mycoplasmopsis bovirhinis]|uniref:Ig-specific serine endopeptidase MIP n=1 Tax=Mycoplasmopsis bovirhinis TaxID=29553 RepID=UPI000E70E5D5|nr:DUF31 family protein [Mycoplasmopsis bovirhinis]